LISAAAFVGACTDGEGGGADGGGADAAPDPTIRCGQGASGKLSAGGKLEIAGAQARDLAGAAVRAPAGADAVTVTIACAADLAPAGYRVLGPAVAFTPAARAQPVDLRLTLPYKPVRVPAGANPGSLVVFMKRRGKVSNLPLLNPTTDAGKGRLSFDLDELATFQVAISDRAGSKIKRRFAYRAIVGFSMGGGAAAIIGLRHPDKFDFIGPLGGEPAGHLDYFVNMLSDSILGGFCTVDDDRAGRGKLGQLCPLPRQPLPRQHELLMSYEKMLYQRGQGVGLTLRRQLYMKGTRDILRAYGNPIYYNPEHPYLPPGVPLSYLSRSGQDVCGKPIKLNKVYDRKYNPDGSKPVITFCDANDSSARGLGVFDPALPQSQPVQILLAVDLNGNGKRDSGEPVVVHSHEPYSDVGTDGKADKDEAGYDPTTNPDPAGDNYHYLKNPTGTERNWRRDSGEPFEDLGIDGVKGTCQARAGVKECYDAGEGNGKFDLSPRFTRWLEHDPFTLYTRLPADKRSRLDIWADAGIRDFLNAHVATNGLMGQVAALGQPVRIYESFKRLLPDPEAAFFDFTKVDWTAAGKNAYVRYGDPGMSQAMVEQTGDGRHVGTAVQIVNRTLSFFAMIQARWPNGDRQTKNIDVGSANFKKNQTFKSPSTGQDRPFAVFLPPGYFQAENQSIRYPVIYFLHGYGQKPDDLMDLSTIFANYMVGRAIQEQERFQKFIIVYVDGRCRPGGTIPLAATGDQCEQGTFYLDSPVSGVTAKMETLMLELMDHIDKTYRTRKPADVEVNAY
jgi:S-formylglutathione hydrolase FrmB